MQQEYKYNVKIPKSRIAVLIGVKGEVKRRIESSCKVRLNIDSKEGDVSIIGKDSILLYSAQEIIRAIARGFNPDISLLLLKQDYALEIINIGEFVGKEQMERARGRVIGEEGKARKNIEAMTGCHISVEGKTVAIIGRIEDVMLCSGAIKKLLQGSKHASAYRWIEKTKGKGE